MGGVAEAARTAAGSILGSCDTSVRSAFIRSSARRRVLVALRNVPEASLSDLARATGLQAHGVIGAIRGSAGRYDPASSLLVLGMIEVQPAGRRRWYRLTRKGREVADALAHAGWVGY